MNELWLEYKSAGGKRHSTLALAWHGDVDQDLSIADCAEEFRDLFGKHGNFDIHANVWWENGYVEEIF